MNTKSIDILNVGLILLSLFLAVQIPFSLFVFAYALLGPLHYFTEINWLSSKQYFVKDTWWVGLVIVLCALLVIPKFFAEPNFPTLYGIESLQPLLSLLLYWSNAIIFLLLAIAFILISTQKTRLRILFIGLACVAAYFFHTAPLYATIIGLLVPTLIHVYLFTLLFMIFGAMRSGSRWGYVAVGLVVIVPFVIGSSYINPQTYLFPDYVKQTMIENSFYKVNIMFGEFLGLTDQTNYEFEAFFMDPMIVKIQVFIAFSYIYHYLNWFSKTTVIGWHRNLTTKRTLLIFGSWLALAGIFLWDYKIGFYAVLFFSFLHVFLEFPLNWISIKGIVGKLVPAKL